MTDTTLLIASLFLLSAAGLANWIWRAVARIEEDLGALGGFEGMHFEIGTQATRAPRAVRSGAPTTRSMNLPKPWRPA